MSNLDTPQGSLFSDILRSFVSLPKWVKFWLLFILGPVNAASLFFLSEPGGVTVAVLVWAGMLLSGLPVPFQRGISKAASIGHLVPWTALVAYIVFATPQGSAAYGQYLTLLTLLNSVSLAFDFVDSFKWLRGDRAVVRPAADTAPGRT